MSVHQADGAGDGYVCRGPLVVKCVRRPSAHFVPHLFSMSHSRAKGRQRMSGEVSTRELSGGEECGVQGPTESAVDSWGR